MTRLPPPPAALRRRAGSVGAAAAISCHVGAAVPGASPAAPGAWGSRR